MKTKIYHLFLVAFFALSVFSCQNEETEINSPDNQEVIAGDSALASFMSSVTANYGAYDDILDDASCFSIELPVTIVVSDINITIETLEDLEELEDLFEDFDDEDDILDFIFPITIIFNDHSEIVIENESQLEEWIASCEVDEEDDDVIECVDFVYPISFSVFNSDFNIVDTVVIESDQALYAFLEGLEDDDNALIVSLNYPITLQYANGDTIEVNSNEELADAIEAAEDDCDEDDEDYDCELELEEVESYLLECAFDVEIENDEDDLVDTLQFNFSQSGELIVTGDATVVDTGSWDLLETDLGIKLVIEGLQTFTIANGLWLLEDCDDDYELEFVQESENGLLYMELELNCDNEEEDEVFDCFDDFELEECLGPNFEVEFNLVANTIGLIDCPFEYISSFHETEADAEANINAIENTESYWSEGGEVYLRIESVGGNFEVFTIYLLTESCDYFECFGNYNLEVCDEDDEVEDGFGVFDLNLIFDNCVNDNVEYEFYLTIIDAETQVNALISPFVNTVAYEQTIYSRVTLAGDPSVFEIFEHHLIVENCYEESCSEEDVDNILQECPWQIVSYNGSDNLIDFYLMFQSNQNLIIEGQGLNIDASWTTSQSDEGVIITFDSVAGPNIQAITGEWLVVECEVDRLQLHRGDDVIVLERNCD